MTFVLGVTSPKAIWLVADRRITPSKGDDTAQKVLDLETPDGRALIGYAGVGRTPGGVEPSEWMSRVLRGRRVDLETAVKFLAAAVRDSLAPIARRMKTPHALIIPALKRGKPTMYAVELAHSPDKRRWFFRASRRPHPGPAQFGQRSPFLFTGGSGAAHLRKAEYLTLRRVVKAFDDGRISAQGAAKQFARLNYVASKRERTVSSRSIVVWRPVQGSGGHLFFDGEVAERPQPRRYCRRSVADSM